MNEGDFVGKVAQQTNVEESVSFSVHAMRSGKKKLFASIVWPMKYRGEDIVELEKTAASKLL